MASGWTRSLRVAGHFGEFIQGRLGPEGPVVLVTLPCPALGMRCDWWPGPFALGQPAPVVIGQSTALALLRRLRLSARARFQLSGDLPPGGGAGASTAARVALARAAAAAAGRPAPAPDVLARACVATEGASDPLMYAEPARLLWQSRAGLRVARLPAPAPFEVVGGFFGPPRRTDPRDHDFPDIADLARAWPAATADAAALARIASASARRLLAHRHPGAAEPIEALADRLGALGFAIAHTGSARALLFRPGTVPPRAGAILRDAGFAGVTRFLTGGGPCSRRR